MEHKDYTEIRFGTLVTREILDRLDSPDDKLKIIHIAGTNGKGSTAEYFTRILIAAGKKTGTFTSPAVYGFYDQFRVDGAPLSGETFEKYFSAAKKAAKGLNATEFELQTAAALYAFYREKCEWAVVECGMGGLNDATNAIHKKELAVITSISLEHTEYLGDTVEKICAQKAGIIKNCPVVVNDLQRYGEAREYFKNLGAVFAGKGAYLDGTSGKFFYDGAEYEIYSPDRAQRYNAQTAIEGAHILGLPVDAIFQGVKNARPAGRVEEFDACGRTYVLDGAHNPCAFEPLRDYLNRRRRCKEVTVIFGCLKDKDIDKNLQALARVCDFAVAVKCPSPRANGLEETAQACGKYFKNVITAESVSAALDKACTKTVVVCGSFTLLKEARQWIEKRQ